MHNPDPSLIEYEHGRLGELVMAIGGHYTLDREVHLSFNNDEIIYLIGKAVFDTTCCGSGGYRYAMVYGYIIDWKVAYSQNGNPVSYLKLIKNPLLRSEICEVIMTKEAITQVHFR